MSKKIVAISLALVLIVTCFVACGKENYRIEKINGQEYVLATNEDGEVITDESGNVIVHPTDASGKVMKNEDGVPYTNRVEAPDYVAKNKIETDEYVFQIKEGWNFNRIANRYEKVDAGRNCVALVCEFEMPEGCETIEDYIEETKEKSKDFIDAIKKQYNYSETATNVSFSDKNIEAIAYEIEIKDNEGKMINYTYSIYFLYGDKVMSVDYICQNGYYEEINAFEFLSGAFRWK